MLADIEMQAALQGSGNSSRKKASWGEDREMQHGNAGTYRHPARSPSCGGRSSPGLPLLGSQLPRQALPLTCLYTGSPRVGAAP